MTSIGDAIRAFASTVRGDGANAWRCVGDVDALACFRFAERMANESRTHGQDDVRWAIAFHEMLELKLEEDPDRTWHRDDWTQLAEPCLGLAPSNGMCRQDTVDLARLAYVGVAARQIARGRAGEAPPKPEWDLRPRGPTAAPLRLMSPSGGRRGWPTSTRVTKSRPPGYARTSRRHARNGTRRARRWSVARTWNRDSV